MPSSLSTKALTSWLWYIWYQWYLISGKKMQLVRQWCNKLGESIIQMFAAAVFPPRLNLPKYTGDIQNSLQWFNCAAFTDISGSHKDKSPHVALKVSQHIGGMRQSQESSPNEPCSLWCFHWIAFLALNILHVSCKKKKSVFTFDKHTSYFKSLNF